MFYAGIGSRATPEGTLSLMREIGAELASRGLILRSGRAAGADSAFEAGHWRAALSSAFQPPEVFTPATELDWPRLMAHAAQFHPNWPACQRLGQYVCRLHARNSAILLGPGLDTPVDFVLYWTPPGRPGGTGQTLRIAEALGIPCFPVTADLSLNLTMGRDLPRP